MGLSAKALQMRLSVE